MISQSKPLHMTVPPFALHYTPSTFKFEFGILVPASFPSSVSSGGNITEYTIGPQNGNCQWPMEGLQFSPSTGKISGTPTKLRKSACVLVVTRSNSQGSTSTVISIAVAPRPLYNLAYRSSSVGYPAYSEGVYTFSLGKPRSLQFVYHGGPLSSCSAKTQCKDCGYRPVGSIITNEDGNSIQIDEEICIASLHVVHV